MFRIVYRFSVVKLHRAAKASSGDFEEVLGLGREGTALLPMTNDAPIGQVVLSRRSYVQDREIDNEIARIRERLTSLDVERAELRKALGERPFDSGSSRSTAVRSQTQVGQARRFEREQALTQSPRRQQPAGWAARATRSSWRF